MKTVALEEICEIIAGQSPPSSTYNKNGDGLPFFQGKADFGKLHPKTRIWCNQPKKVAEKGDILISVRAPVGPTNVCDQQCCIGRGLSAIRPRKDIDQHYLLYYLRKVELEISNKGRGSTFSAITQKDLKSIKIPFPSLEEQKRIVRILDQADSLRQKRQKAISLLDDYLKAVFLEMFGDPVKNPKGWEKISLGDACHSIKDGPHVSPHYVEKGVPFISVNNIIRGWDFTNVRYISEEDHRAYIRKSKPEKGDVLYTKGGTTGFAKCIDLDFEFSNWVHLAVLKFDKTKLNGIFLEKMLNTDFCYQQSQRYTRGIANRDLVLGQIKKIKIYLPPLAMQEQFTVMVLKSSLAKEKMFAQQNEIENNFNALMQGAFNT